MDKESIFKCSWALHQFSISTWFEYMPILWGHPEFKDCQKKTQTFLKKNKKGSKNNPIIID